MIARSAHAGAEVRPFGSSLRSPHHPFGTVPPLSNRGCYVPQGRTSAPSTAHHTEAFATPSHPSILLALLLFAVACSGPGSYEEFVRAEDAPGGVYEFVVPDGAPVIPGEAKEPATCDLSFYTAPLKEPLQLEIVLDSLKETVWFPFGQHKALYRSSVRLAGAEALRVRPNDPPERFRGLGIIIKRNDGTR